MVVKSTRLRYISSKDPSKLIEFVDALPFKIEIKGAPVYDGNAFFLFFVLSDSTKEFNSLSLD